jgi:peroxiredoxin-like protein
MTVKPYPHRYEASSELAGDGAQTVQLSSPGLAALESAPPVEFDGPGDRWSPETLLLGAVADCIALTFRAVARASKYEWTHLRCRAEGVLDRADGAVRFTEVHVHAELETPAGADPATGERLLAKAERSCLISNSLRAAVSIEPTVRSG